MAQLQLSPAPWLPITPLPQNLMSNRLGQKNIDMHSKLCCCLHPHLFSDSFNPQFLGENPSPKKKETYPPDLAQGTSISGATKFASNSSQVICAGDLLSWGLRGLPSKVQCFNSLLIKKSWIFRHGSNFGGPSFFYHPPLHHR